MLISNLCECFQWLPVYWFHSPGAWTGCLSSHKDQGTEAIKKTPGDNSLGRNTVFREKKPTSAWQWWKQHTLLVVRRAEFVPVFVLLIHLSLSISLAPSFPFVLSISMLFFPPPPSVHKRGSLWFIKRSEFRPEGTGCAWRHLKDPAVRDLSFLLRRRHGLPSPPNLLLL